MQPNSISLDPHHIQAVDHPALVIQRGTVVVANQSAIDDIGCGLEGGEMLSLVCQGDRDAVLSYLGSRDPVVAPVRITLLAEEGPRIVESSWLPVEYRGESATLMTWRAAEPTTPVHEWLAAVTDSSMDLIAIADHRGNLLYMNDAMLRLRGDASREGLPDGRIEGARHPLVSLLWVHGGAVPQMAVHAGGNPPHSRLFIHPGGIEPPEPTPSMTDSRAPTPTGSRPCGACRRRCPSPP